MADQTPELDGASEEALELELEPEVPIKKEPEELGGDPLDEISDPVVRAQAKKDRAIARRLAKKEETPKPEANPDTSKFLTKADFYKANERKAILEIQKDDAEIKANWNAIIPFYTPRRGKETPGDIVEDIRDAIILFKARNPESPAKDDSKDELTASPVLKTGGGVVDKVTSKPKDPPNFKLPTDPKSWYPKKS